MTPGAQPVGLAGQRGGGARPRSCCPPWDRSASANWYLPRAWHAGLASTSVASTSAGRWNRRPDAVALF